jgi:hypothetical protein
MAKGKEFKLYSQYFSGGGIAFTQNKYKEFCELFGFEYNESSIELLRMFLSDTYKKSSIQEAKEEHTRILNNPDFIPYQQLLLHKICNELNEWFSKETKEIQTQHVVFYDCPEPCFELLRKKNERLEGEIRAGIFVKIIRLLMGRVKTQHIDFRKPIIPTLMERDSELKNESINTAIGNSDCCSYLERESLKKLLEKFTVFLVKEIRDALFFVSQADSYLRIYNLTVSLHNLDQNEILSGKEPHGDGLYYHTVTNDLVCAFTTEEFVEFIQNQQLILTIEGDIDYGFSSEYVGYGVIIDFPTEP